MKEGRVLVQASVKLTFSNPPLNALCPKKTPKSKMGSFF
jgi:hypothetical protein